MGKGKLSTEISSLSVTVGAGVPEGRIKRAALVGPVIILMATESLNVHVTRQPVPQRTGPPAIFF